MTDPMSTILVVGASGSIGRHVVDQTLHADLETRALVRDQDQAKLFLEGTKVVVGEPTDTGVLAEALDGVTGIVFTQGTYIDDDAEQANYRPVRAALEALKSPARIALMTALGVTKPAPGHNWKRRVERLVRASCLPYTIVRPGWFDYNKPGEQRLVFRQGDTHWAGSPEDGVVSRAQIAQVLIVSLVSERAGGKTFELVADAGDARGDLDLLFSALEGDRDATLDGPQDRDYMPRADEPASVVADLDAVRGTF